VTTLLRITVALDTPQHAGLASLLDYTHPTPLAPGTLVRVPLGKRELAGVVWPRADEPGADIDVPLRPITEVLDAIAPLSAAWRGLVEFCAAYYQRNVGEVAMSVLPPELRRLGAEALARRQARLKAAVAGTQGEPQRPALSDEQAAVLDALASLPAGAEPPTLLHGVTGSGKTEVYLRQAERVLAAGRQVLVLVPEINLTPQLEARFAERFPGRVLVSQHSGMTPAQRLKSWLLAHRGQADLVLGTRLAVFVPLPRLGLIVVDEEHDPSFKQQDGARYSARDLAVYRARQEHSAVILGSATPSLESWQRVLEGRYRRLVLAGRMGGGALPRVRIVDMGQLPQPRGAPPVLAPALLQAVRQRIEAGEQSLLLLNRRGYAPVLHCGACGWKSGCPHCSAWRVFHKSDRTLRCHHCGYTERVPKACPDCGNLDIAPIGRGTEKLEEQLSALLPGARIARIDADTTRRAGALQSQLAAVHAGDVDVLVGTQIVAKGHDFRRITLVAAVNPDGALFASDFRAPERLFSLLMQAAGRAGRDAEQAARSEMWVQTWHPRHGLYEALRRGDFDSFAASQLAERRAAGLPPYTHLALLRAEAKDAAHASAFLQDAALAAAALPGSDAVTLYPPVPPTMARVAGVERMQLLAESPSRPALQRLLAAWLPVLHTLKTRHRSVQRWAIDVDPLAI
jgi:primosomal protein N' (replication factor Y) (superfamily II helicase)